MTITEGTATASPGSGHGDGLRVAPFIVIVVLLVLAMGIGFALRPARAPASYRVGLVGDSITDQARRQLHDAFPPPDELRIEAVPGRTIEEMIPAARAVAADHPDHVVLNLGSNDVLLDVPMARSIEMLDELYGVFDRGTCVSVVNVNETFFLMFQDTLSKHAKALNEVIARKAAEHGFVVVDWARIVTDYLAAGQPQGALTADTVHPTDVGKAILADAYRTSVASCTPGREPPAGAARLRG